MLKQQTTKYYKWGEPNITLVGSPTVNNGVISGFSKSNYATVLTMPSANSIEFGGKFSYSSSITGVACIFEVSTTSYTGFNIAISDGSIRLWTNTETAFGRQIEIGKDYWFKCECNSNGSLLWLSTDGKTYTQEIYLANNEFNSWVNSLFSLGVRVHNKTEAFTSGSIYLKDCYMKVNDKNAWTGLKIEKATSTNYDFSRDEDCYFTAIKNYENHKVCLAIKE